MAESTSINHDASSPARQFWLGLRAITPILLGDTFGVFYGVLALQAGISHLAAQAMSAIVFAGSSQFIAVQLVHQSAPGLVIIFTIFIVNLRHALYSASVSSYLQNLSQRWKIILAYLLTDEAYAIAITRYEKYNLQPFHQYYFLGAGIGMWAGWQLSTAAGIFLGAVIPSTWPLDFALPLTFIALLVPNLKDRAGTFAAVTAGIAALLVFSLPFKLGILAAALVGMTAGILIEDRQK